MKINAVRGTRRSQIHVELIKKKNYNTKKSNITRYTDKVLSDIQIFSVSHRTIKFSLLKGKTRLSWNDVWTIDDEKNFKESTKRCKILSLTSISTESDLSDDQRRDREETWKCAWKI